MLSNYPLPRYSHRVLKRRGHLRRRMRGRATERKKRRRYLLLKHKGHYIKKDDSPHRRVLSHRTHTFTCPNTLNFDEFPEETAQFLMSIRALSQRNSHDVIRVDHRELKQIDAPSALILMAEMFRADTMTEVELRATLPSDPACRDLLGEMGYYRYFDIEKWERPNSTTKFFLEHQRGEGVNQNAARLLLKHLSQSHGPLATREFSMLLYEALLEGMQNASEWGYGNKRSGYRSWWLLGYRDTETGEISYCFYDQGATIPKTIRTRFKDRIPWVRPPGSSLIFQAVSGSYSSTKLETRGRGLPTLKRFVDSAGWGKLTIFSRGSLYVHEKGKPDILKDFTCHLRGTLVAWTFRPDR